MMNQNSKMTRREACYFLGIGENASEEQIKRAYRYKAKLYHPDANPDSDTKEYYIDKTNLEFEAQDVLYKEVKFKYAEIAEILNQGGTIEIKSSTGEVLHTLNASIVSSQEDCELVLNGDIHGVEISVKDIKVNGTITVDFVKSIGKCAYEKATFNNFEKIESRVKAQVKYGTSDEVIELTPLKAEKYFEKSKNA